MTAKFVKYDKEAQIKKSKEIHGEDVFRNAGRKGGLKNPLKFDSDRGRAAAQARWAKHRAAKPKMEKGE